MLLVVLLVCDCCGFLRAIFYLESVCLGEVGSGDWGLGVCGWVRAVMCVSVYGAWFTFVLQPQAPDFRTRFTHYLYHCNRYHVFYCCLA